MYKYEDIKTIHLENTQNCQASCPMCDRNQNGGALNPHIDLSELTLEDVKRIFEPNFIKQLDTMYMCGNLGDPIIARDTLEIFKYFREHNPTMWLSMNTNAGARDEAWWTELAHTLGRMGTVIFSVDGLSDTNHIYRQGVKWDAVYRSMKAFIAAGGRARWDFLIFEHNQHQVDEAEELSQTMGFEKFIAKKTGRFITSTSNKKETHQAVNRKGNETAELKKPDAKYQNKALSNQDKLLEKYGSMDAYYDVVPINCKVKDEGNLFITAEGLTLPCCWTAGRMYKWWHKDPKQEQIWDFIEAAGGKDALNAKKHGLKAVFETGIFDNIEASWNVKGCVNGKLKVCSMKCGIEFDPFGEQFK
jgi:MoaA/NifB/PqqE/SkfB family radical SAM enzyme